MKNAILKIGPTFLLLLAGCNTPVNEQLVSYFPAPTEQIAIAKDAAEICARTSSAPQLREILFRSSGFVAPSDPSLQAMATRERGKILVKPNTDVVIQLGGDGGTSGCIVGVKGMTPQQSFDLALPLVQKYGAVSNKELGQGLAHNVIQAWRATDENPTVFIAAYKTWDVLGEPGAAIRTSR